MYKRQAPEQVEQAAALVKAGKVKVEVAQVPQKLYVDVTVKGEGHTGRAVVQDLSLIHIYARERAVRQQLPHAGH